MKTFVAICCVLALVINIISDQGWPTWVKILLAIGALWGVFSKD